MTEVKGYVRAADDRGSVNISQNVLATIAAAAAVDVDGIYGLYQSHGRELVDVSGKKGISKGVKITIEEDSITADLSLICLSGCSVSEAAAQVQKAVAAAVEEAAGIKVSRVNVNICGISMKKPAKTRENKGRDGRVNYGAKQKPASGNA